MAKSPATSNDIEEESVKVCVLNTQQNNIDDGVHVSLNLEIIPHEQKIVKSRVCTSNENDEDDSCIILEEESDKNISEDCSKPTLTIKTRNLIPLESNKKNTSATFRKESDGAVHFDFSQDGSWKNNTKNQLISENKCKIPGENEFNDSSLTFLQEHTEESLQKANVLSNDNFKDKEDINDVKNYTLPDGVFQKSKISFHDNITTNSCYDNSDEGTGIQMLCENKGDGFSKRSAVVISLDNEICSNHAYHQTDPGPDLSILQSSSSDSTGLHSYHKQTVNEEMQSDQYENIEFSTIFSSVDMYQQSLDQSYTVENTHSQVNEGCQNFIANLNSQSFDKSISDSGMFGISLSDTDYLQSSVQYPQKAFTAIVKAEQNSTMMFPSEDQNSTFTMGYNQSNTSFSDQRIKMLNCQNAGYREYHSSGQQKSSTMTLNSMTVPFPYGHCEKPLSESYVHDPYLDDYNRTYQKSLYQNPQEYTNEWNPWAHGSSTAYDLLSPFTTSKQATHFSSSDVLGDVEKPDVQFLQMNDKEDDEETDDADEIAHLPLAGTTKHNHFWPNHSGAGYMSGTVHHVENSCSSCGPSVLTPPPSASSTPIPQSSQDGSSTLDDIALFSPWAAAHYDRLNRFNSTCKLKTEQLETGLLNFGLNQCTKRPFPSMADVMHRRSKSGSRKKYIAEVSPEQPRRSGRPRKIQIQSDKISTTAVSKKQKKKSLKCETRSNVTSSPEKKDTGSSRTSAATRHNEPLNQRAVEIMTQWFDDHIENPYPSKDDKKVMAAQGGITENQVKSWFANKRNRTNNTKPKVQKRAMEEKLKEIFRDLKRNHQNPMADNTRVIQQLSGIIHHCRSAKLD